MCSKNNSMNKRFLCTIDCFLVCFLTYTIRIFLAQQCIIYCLTSYKYITISIVSFFIQCFFVDFFESARKLVFFEMFRIFVVQLVAQLARYAIHHRGEKFPKLKFTYIL
uniref:(northern house mosquito) hypothetical protein n=1 Tax=Culex pipiens TaxID=7175 RepID=A0A8D8E6P1_CULPI